MTLVAPYEPGVSLRLRNLRANRLDRYGHEVGSVVLAGDFAIVLIASVIPCVVPDFDEDLRVVAPVCEAHVWSLPSDFEGAWRAEVAARGAVIDPTATPLARNDEVLLGLILLREVASHRAWDADLASDLDNDVDVALRHRLIGPTDQPGTTKEST